MEGNMTGYLILSCVILITVACLGVYFTGKKHGKETAAAKYAVEKSRAEAEKAAAENARQKDEKDYRDQSTKIKQEVSQNAETKKAELSGHADAADRFNAINASLRQPAGPDKN
jgi:uncharacterized protein (UPF0333 family)